MCGSVWKGRRETYIGMLDGVTVPRNTKHAVAAGFNHEFVLSGLDDVSRNDIFDATVTAVASSNALERGAIGRVDHGFAARIELDYMRGIMPLEKKRRSAHDDTHIARGRTVPSNWESSGTPSTNGSSAVVHQSHRTHQPLNSQHTPSSLVSTQKT